MEYHLFSSNHTQSSSIIGSNCSEWAIPEIIIKCIFVAGTLFRIEDGYNCTGSGIVGVKSKVSRSNVGWGSGIQVVRYISDFETADRATAIACFNIGGQGI